MRPVQTGLVYIALIIAVDGCARGRRAQPELIDLPPAATQPLYRLQVADADEAALLKQELKLDVEGVRGQDVYFRGDERTLAALKDLEYAVTPVDPRQVMSRVVRVMRRGIDEAQLLKTGVSLINREKTHWVVRATPRQLELLQGRRVDVRALDAEVHPRQVRIVVNEPADVQRVNELHVDIYSAARSRDGKVVIEGAAFDNQIDALRNANYQVTVLPPPPNN